MVRQLGLVAEKTTLAFRKGRCEMIPAGPERDTKIAEMRGECTHSDKRLMPTGDFYCVDCHIFSPFFKSYSTDISCAMELWEEMHTSGETGLDHWRANTWKFDIGYRARIENVWKGIEVITNAKHASLNSALADAISGAYVKWRAA
jgi:hypothetical protein